MQDIYASKEPIDLEIGAHYLHSLCELQDEKNRLISHCRVAAVYEHTLELKQTMEDAIDPNLPFGMPVKMNIFTKKTGLQVLSGIAHGYRDEKIIIAGAEVLLNRERREFFRVPISEIGTLGPINPPPEKAVASNRSRADRKKAKSPYKEIKVDDISLSGLQFGSEDSFDLGNKFIIEFAPLNQHQRRVCEIVRKRKGEGSMFHYGCKFLQMREFDLNELSRLIMKIQQSTRSRYRET